MTAARRVVVVVLAVALSAVLPALPSFATGETATGDVTPPRLLSLSLDPAAVDVSDGPAQTVVTVRLADEGTGVQWALLEFHRPARAAATTAPSARRCSWLSRHAAPGAAALRHDRDGSGGGLSG